MSMRQSIGGRSSFMLYLALILILALVAVLAVIFLVIIPDRQRRWEAEAQRMQATATAEARAAEIQRAYAAGVAFAAAGDWDKAAEEFAKVVALEPTYKDAAARMAEARSKATTESGTATATVRENELRRAYDMGVAYATAKDWEKAAEQFTKVIVIEPDYRDAAAQLAEARAKARIQAEADRLATATAEAKDADKSTFTPTATSTPARYTRQIGFSLSGRSPEWPTGDGAAAGHVFIHKYPMPSSGQITGVVYLNDSEGSRQEISEPLILLILRPVAGGWKIIHRVTLPNDDLPPSKDGKTLVELDSPLSVEKGDVFAHWHSMANPTGSIPMNGDRAAVDGLSVGKYGFDSADAEVGKTISANGFTGRRDYFINVILEWWAP